METIALRARRMNLDFIEGIIIGIYGNFLIALLDRIDFETISWINLGLLFASFLAFIVYFICQISAEEPMTSFKMNILLIAFHYYGWLSAYLTQGITTERVLFSFVGVLLFGTLYVAEKRRARLLA